MNLEGIFTKQERLALGFFIGVGLLGMGFHLLRLDRPAAPRAYGPNGPEAASYVPRPGVSVNRASEAELTALPGIGPVLAERILRDRKLHGRFLTLGDLARVKGMTPKTLEKIKGFVRFD